MATSHKQKAFAAILSQARTPAQLYLVPAYVGLIRLATLNGRVPFRLALTSLTAREAAIVQSTFGREDIMIVPPDSDDMDRCNFLVAHSPYGKLSLYERTAEAPEDTSEIIGGIQIERSLLNRIEDECLEESLLEAQVQRQLDAMLFGWEAAGVIDRKVAQVADWVDHVETVFVYIGRQLFSRSDAGSSTLIKRPGLLHLLKGRPVAEWSVAERLFTATAQLLFLTGMSIRFEEFNGRQLTALRIKRWLMQKACVYYAALDQQVPADLVVLSLEELATRVGQLAVRVDQTDWIRFRRINGITFVKEECLIHAVDHSHHPDQLAPLLVDFAAQALGLQLDPALSPQQSVATITAAALRKAGQTSSTADLEQIIQRIILSAVLESGADYGMSSSFRDLTQLKSHAGMLTMTKKDFFCCVLPHPHIAETMPQHVLAEILHSVALRMEFNRWHFIAGNFDREEVPLDRHYFFPPRMPDIAEWSDLHHGGHTGACVRYSIRAPGAQLWNPPFFAFGHAYRGCYDVRLVRMEGPPFEKHDMYIASRHCSLMDAFWRTIQRFIEEEGGTCPALNGYTGEWYKRGEWKDFLAECSLQSQQSADLVYSM